MTFNDILNIEFAKKHFVDNAFFVLNLEATHIYDMYRETVDIFFKKDNVSDDFKRTMVNTFVEREHILTTYLGNGIAIPHINCEMGTSSVLKVGWFRSLNGVPSISTKKQTAYLFLSVIASENLQLLCSIGIELLESSVLRSNLLSAQTEVEMKKSILKQVESLRAE